MQNIPGIELEKTSEPQLKSVSFSSVKQSDKQMLFADLFDQHSNRIENELALTPVSTKDKMVEVAPATATEVKEEGQEKVNAANTKAPVKEDKEPEVERDQDERMTQEDLDEVREDLKAYGMTEEEIAEIEEEINSEDGMTWGEFVNVISEKMAELRQISLDDGQKDQLGTFFAKFGFTKEESAKLISKLENGDQAEVMAALKEKLDAMPKAQQLVFTKDEVEAFSAAMNFSKEFTSKVKEVLGQNLLSKDMKEAFTMIRQEMAEMDTKDKKLVEAVGKQFVAAMGDKAKETTVAKEVEQAVDLKPRVGEEAPKTPVREEFKEAVEVRKETMPENNARKTEQKVMPEQQVKSDQEQQAKPDMEQHQPETEDDNWNNFFAKLQDNSTQKAQTTPFQAKTENIESLLKTGLAEAQAETKTRSWEKISAPKVMQQVENAFFQNLGNGNKQLTLQLTPENLGKLSVMLSVQGKEVSATIRAESPEAAKLIADNIDLIKNSLENQGLKVDKLDVQTGLSSDHDFHDWAGQEQHNLAREREAMVAMRQHMRQMREENGQVAHDMQSNHEPARHADQGLHVIA